MGKKYFRHVSGIKWLVGGILSFLLIAGGFACAPSSFAFSPSRPQATQAGPFDFANRTFWLNGQPLTFRYGLYESANGHHSARITDRSVNLATNEAVAILMDNPEGSGRFYYVLGATRRYGCERYSAPAFLGDRIVVKAVSVGEGKVVVRYLDRPASAPLAMPPTERVTAIYAFQANGNLYRVSLWRG